VLCRYFDGEAASEAESSDAGPVRRWWHKKLADFFQFCSNLQRKVEVFSSALCSILIIHLSQSTASIHLPIPVFVDLLPSVL